MVPRIETLHREAEAVRIQRRCVRGIRQELPRRQFRRLIRPGAGPQTHRPIEREEKPIRHAILDPRDEPQRPHGGRDGRIGPHDLLHAGRAPASVRDPRDEVREVRHASDRILHDLAVPHRFCIVSGREHRPRQGEHGIQPRGPQAGCLGILRQHLIVELTAEPLLVLPREHDVGIEDDRRRARRAPESPDDRLPDVRGMDVLCGDRSHFAERGRERAASDLLDGRRPVSPVRDGRARGYSTGHRYASPWTPAKSAP